MSQTNIPKPQADINKYIKDLRMCLNCENYFMSEWAGNRICSNCASSTKFKRAIDLQTLPVHIKK